MRDELGRWRPGNRAAIGHGGGAAFLARHRGALLAAVTDEDIAEVARALVAEAKAGNVLAIRELFDRTMGKVREQLEVTHGVEEVIRERWEALMRPEEEVERDFEALTEPPNGGRDAPGGQAPAPGEGSGAP